VPFTPKCELPSRAELVRAVAWLVEHCDVDRLKITGGEPLVYRGVVDLVRSAAALEGIREISMTTNGTRLTERAASLKASGLTRVNVSLDTLDERRFAELTRGGDLRRVLSGISAARSAGLAPVKLNSVLRRSSWRQDVPALLDFAAGERLEIRFIELMRTGTETAWAESEAVAADGVRSFLERGGRLNPLPTPTGASARRTLARWRGRDVVVGWITPISHSFCAACDRLRLDARGQLRRCLMDPLTLPLVPLLREGRGEEALHAVAGFLAGKRAPEAMDSAVPMRALGG
jgi:cyclic pyranopterin phosphate synthase